MTGGARDILASDLDGTPVDFERFEGA